MYGINIMDCTRLPAYAVCIMNESILKHCVSEDQQPHNEYSIKKHMKLLRAFHTCKVRIDADRSKEICEFCNVFFPNLKARMFIT